MYFWRIKQLKEELIQNGLSQKVIFQYMLFYFVLISLQSFSSKVPTIYDTYSASISLFLNVIGMMYAFKMNNGNDGTQFAERYFSITFVVTIRYFPWMLLSYVIFGIVLRIQDQLSLKDVVFMYLEIIWELMVLISSARHIRDVAQKKNP
jgi:hypothetical protein